MTDNKGRMVITTGLVGEFAVMIYDIRWLFIIMASLIAADLYLGTSESRKKYALTKNEKYKVRFSTAFRRTFNKSVDYLCYVLIAGTFAKAFAEPSGVSVVLTASIICLLVAAWELSSVIGHICYLHNIPYRFNPKKFIISLIKKKDEELGEAADEAIEDNSKTENNG